MLESKNKGVELKFPLFSCTTDTEKSQEINVLVVLLAGGMSLMKLPVQLLVSAITDKHARVNISKTAILKIRLRISRNCGRNCTITNFLLTKREVLPRNAGPRSFCATPVG